MTSHLSEWPSLIINKQQSCEEKGTLVHRWWECILVQAQWKTVEFPQKSKMELPCHLAIPLLGMYPKNPETPIQKNLCTPMFIAVLFIIAKRWKQPMCPSVDEWIKKLVHLHNGIVHNRKRRHSYLL